jgi:hypothetical protein
MSQCAYIIIPSKKISIKLGQCFAVLRLGNSLGPLSTSLGILLKYLGMSFFAGLGIILSIDNNSSLCVVIIISFMSPPLFIF